MIFIILCPKFFFFLLLFFTYSKRNHTYLYNLIMPLLASICFQNKYSSICIMHFSSLLFFSFIFFFDRCTFSNHYLSNAGKISLRHNVCFYNQKLMTTENLTKLSIILPIFYFKRRPHHVTDEYVLT